MTLHLYSQGWDHREGHSRPGYSEWRHTFQCWCVSKPEFVVGFSPYYRYAWRSIENPPEPEHSKKIAEAYQ